MWQHLLKEHDMHSGTMQMNGFASAGPCRWVHKAAVSTVLILSSRFHLDLRQLKLSFSSPFLCLYLQAYFYKTSRHLMKCWAWNGRMAVNESNLSQILPDLSENVWDIHVDFVRFEELLWGLKWLLMVKSVCQSHRLAVDSVQHGELSPLTTDVLLRGVWCSPKSLQAAILYFLDMMLYRIGLIAALR